MGASVELPTYWTNGTLDAWGRPVLGPDVPGAVYPQINDPRNVLLPVASYAGEGREG